MPSGRRNFIAHEQILFGIAVAEFARWIAERQSHPILVTANDKFGKMKPDTQLCCLAHLTEVLFKDKPELKVHQWTNATIDAVLGWILFRVMEEIELQRTGESDSVRWRRRVINSYAFSLGPILVEQDSTNIKSWEKSINAIAASWIWQPDQMKQTAISGGYPDTNPISVKFARKYLLEDIKEMADNWIKGGA